jgi:hypothetical protein
LVHNPYYKQNEETVRGSRLTEAVSDKKIVISAITTPSSEKIAERNTIVYETRIDQALIEVAGNKIKAQLFTRFGFMKPKQEEIRLMSIDKYYEPYVMISGRYVIDYYRKCAYTIRVDKKVQEVVLLNNEFEPSQPMDSSAKDHNMIRLEGEERLKYEIKASLVLDKYGQEIKLEKLPAAPPERNPKKILEESGVKEIAPDADLDIIRSRILKRPKDIDRIVTELFEVSGRTIIYTPRFRVLYTNVRTGEEKTVEFDGVTVERIQRPKYPFQPF